MRDLAFVAAWSVLLPLALQGAHLGVLLWAWTSLLAPNDVLYGLGAGLPFAKVAALLTLGLMLLGRGGGVRLRWDPTVLLMLSLGALRPCVTGGRFVSQYRRRLGIYRKYAKILMLAVVASAVMQDRLRLHALLLAICLGIGFTGLGEGAKFLLSGGGHKVQGSSFYRR